MRTYIVQPGDTLSAIARDQLGDITAWPALAQANSLSNPDMLSVGQVLQLPDLVTTVDQGTPAPAPQAQNGFPTWAKIGLAASAIGAGVALVRARRKKKLAKA